MIDEILIQMREEATVNHVPILEDHGAKVLIDLLAKIKPQRILELGTAIGYSALLMYKYTHAEITTIERDKMRYQRACSYLDPLKLSIDLIYGDALDVDTKNWDMFDVIYFDAAKAQNEKFFHKYSPLLKHHGVIIIDNLLFHGLTFKPQTEIESRNLRQLSRKLQHFISFAQNLEGYQFYLLENGDGIGILYKE